MPVLVTSQLRYDAGGVPTLVRTTIFDASAYQRYERQLVEERDRAQQAADEARRARVAADAANEGKSRFLAAMNHEYRTPINIIAGFAELLAASEVRATDAERAEYLGEMRAASLHLLGLLEDATRYGRLDELERSPRLGPARLRSVAGGGLRLARPVIDARAVEVVLEAGEDDPEVLSNPAIDEAIACVLRDIARRAPVHTGLRIGVRTAADGGVIELRGSALGGSDAALQALVSPLNAPEVLGRGLEGSGLGMAFAERVLRICGGSLAIGQTTEGKSSLVLRFGTVLSRSGRNALAWRLPAKNCEWPRARQWPPPSMLRAHPSRCRTAVVGFSAMLRIVAAELWPISRSRLAKSCIRTGVDAGAIFHRLNVC
jgi:signal transduction histidine kinase